MAIDVWVNEDIRRTLNSIYFTSEVSIAFSGEENTLAYRQGFHAALTAVALAFDVKPIGVDPSQGRLIWIADEP